mgnify:CR=1 FL=1
MAKRNAKAQKSNELDGKEFFAAIGMIEQEKGTPKGYMLVESRATRYGYLYFKYVKIPDPPRRRPGDKLRI